MFGEGVWAGLKHVKIGIYCVTKVTAEAHVGTLPFSDVLHSVDACKFTTTLNMAANEHPLKDVAIGVVHKCL